MKNSILYFAAILLIVSRAVALQGQSDNIKKINNVNMLLPVIYGSVENRNIEHTLVGYNGCYDWSTSQPSILRVKEISDDRSPQCHSQAVVSLATSRPSNNIVWITAKDKGNN